MNLQTVKESGYIIYPDLNIVKEKYANLYKQIECFLSLKMIGFWKNDEFPNFPIPIENSRTYNDNMKEKIICYLSNIYLKKLRYLGYYQCRICNCDNGLADIYDEEYIWPQGLVHYVKIHNVDLPPEFINHILKKMRNPKFWQALREVQISVKELLEKPRLRVKQSEDQTVNNISLPQTLLFISYSEFYSKNVRKLFSYRCRIDNKLYPTVVKKRDTIHKLAIYLVDEMSQIYILEWIAEKDNTTEIYNQSSIKFLRVCSYEELKMQKILDDFRNEMSVSELWNKYRNWRF